MGHTDDWCFTTEGGVIRDLKKGGDCRHHMYGISYWSAEDGRRLADDLPRAFEDGPTKQRFWDDVPSVQPNHPGSGFSAGAAFRAAPSDHPQSRWSDRSRCVPMELGKLVTANPAELGAG